MTRPDARFQRVRGWLGSPKGRRVVSTVLMVIVLVFSALAIHDNWSGVRRALNTLGWADLVLTEAMALTGVYCLYRAWRALLVGLAGAEHPIGDHDLRTMFFCSQMGKYVPGSVWPAVIQAEIGHRNRMPRSIVVSSYAFALLAGVAGGGLLSIGTLAHHTRGWIVVGAIGAFLGGVVLSVSFFQRSMAARIWGRLLRGRLTTEAAAKLRGSLMARTLLWTLGAWVTMGLHAWALARPLGASAGNALFVAGAFALAWTAGLVAVPLPAGAGLREVVLVFAIGTLIGHDAATSVALVSRVLMLANDVVLSLLAGLPALLRSARHRRPDGVEQH